jgi:alpha-tubulin suppressor-like RCC1 family protein
VPAQIVSVEAKWPKRLSTGPSQSCAIDGTGSLYCWGAQAGVQALAISTTTVPNSATTETPLWSSTPSFTRLTETFNQGFCGEAADGWWCWGRNGFGELARPASSGNGVLQFSASPRMIEITFGRLVACGVAEGASGAGFCWGNNQQGALGSSQVPVGSTTATPSPVDGGHVFTSIVAGWLHSCGLTSGGEAYCWGRKDNGRLGDGSPSDLSVAASPVKVAGSDTLGLVQLTLGSNHTCALSQDGRAYCWGFNGVGQLGDGTTTFRNTPTAVAGNHRFTYIQTNGLADATGAGGVQNGGGHTCALKADGEAWCWGNNEQGQLGDGTRTRRLAPVPVAGGLRFNAVDLGDLHSCGMRGSSVWCWGRGGWLGDGTREQRDVPVAIQPPTNPDSARITSQPQSVSVVEGSPASFSVAATGTQLVTYEWFIAGTPGGPTGITGPSLGIASTTFDDDGLQVYARVCNFMNCVNSNTVTLTVTPPPGIVALVPGPGHRAAVNVGTQRNIGAYVRYGTFPMSQQTVTWSPSAGSTGTGSVTDSDGLAQTTLSAPATPQIVTVTASSSAAQAPTQLRLGVIPIGYQSAWLGGSGGDRSWNLGANWSDDFVPQSSQRSVYILAGPGGPRVTQPITGTGQIASLGVQEGTSLEIVGATTQLTVVGDLDASGPITGEGIIAISGNRSIRGQVVGPRVSSSGGTLTLSGATNISGVVGAGSLALNGFRLQAGSHLTTSQLTSTHAESEIIVTGGFGITGNTTPGLITAGSIEARSDFSQSGPTQFFDAGPDHVVRLTGSGLQSVTFVNPGEQASRFGTLIIGNSSAEGVSLTSNISVSGTLEMAPSSRLSVADGKLLRVANAVFRANSVFTLGQDAAIEITGRCTLEPGASVPPEVEAICTN